MRGFLHCILLLAMSSLPLVVSFCASKFTSTAIRRQHNYLPRQWPSSHFSTASITRLYHSDRTSTTFWRARQGGCWRPDVSDVERISWGKPAKRKRTGSRGVPHRLNQEERFLYDQARQKGFLEVAGSAWRSQRRDAPLLNTYRSLCDARGKVCIVLHKSNTGVEDEVVVDLSPLRFPEDFDRIESILHEDDKIPSLDNSDENDSTSREIQQLLKPYAEHVLALNRDIEDEEESTWITEDGESSKVSNDVDQWENRPIYQLPPYYVSWGRLQRSNAKTLSKLLSVAFNVPDPKAAKKSLKPKGVKAGKSRRSGGYGIG
mmetsp:Transcript_32819/g.49486  ORF Transcript_32819/g.49486 Transcript_32819/m.49486 type:complete len:318 (-) Transcript_32819:2646-3599(-)